MDLERDTARTQKQIGAIADLLIGTPTPQDTTAPLRLTGTRAPVQLVIAATLPGTPRPWVGQYAHHVARARGPAALARVDADRIELEVYGDAGTPVETNDFDQAIAALGPAVSDWLIAIDPDQLLADGAGGWAADRWTVLTGADEESIVDAYSLLRAAMRLGPAPDGGVGLMVMGCDPSQAQQAWGRLHRAAEQHLGVDVAFVGSHQRIEPVRRRRASAPVEGARDRLIAFLSEATAASREPVDAEAPAETPASKSVPSEELSLRCPYHPSVSLRIDHAGRLHLDLEAEGTPHEAICRLMAAGAWARDHADWIARAAAPTAMGDASPALHLWTTAPDAARAVADWWPGPDKPIRVHGGRRPAHPGAARA